MRKKGLDYHLHTVHLGCANQTMTVEALLRRCEEWRMTSIGITDHLNSLDRLPDHEKIARDLQECSADLEVFFGAELNVVSIDPEPQMPYDEEAAQRLGFTYTVAGPHGTYCGDEYDLEKIVKTQHELMVWCLRNPVVDVPLTVDRVPQGFGLDDLVVGRSRIPTGGILDPGKLLDLKGPIPFIPCKPSGNRYRSEVMVTPREPYRSDIADVSERIGQDPVTDHGRKAIQGHSPLGYGP